MSQSSVLVIFPNQLFKNHPGLKTGIKKIILIEDSLFFGDLIYQNNLHKQKLWLHRASMKNYASWLEKKGFEVSYEEHSMNNDVLLKLLKRLKSEKILNVITCETHDYELNQRLHNNVRQLSLKLEVLSSPMFLNCNKENFKYRDGKKGGLWPIFTNFREGG